MQCAVIAYRILSMKWWKNAFLRSATPLQVEEGVVFDVITVLGPDANEIWFQLELQVLIEMFSVRMFLSYLWIE